MEVKMEASWKQQLAEEFNKPYFRALAEFVRAQYLSTPVYPLPENIFNALSLCPFGQVKVVLLGQDPYHGPRQAHGLAFSVQKGVALPPSLLNIFKEIADDLGVVMSGAGDLSAWAKQGVLLLNATLTVRAGEAGSHQRQGWEEFTDAIIRKIAIEKDSLVFLLWGAYAQSKAALIDDRRHLILKAPHPSPLSAYRGFFGCKHFSRANQYLIDHNQTPIDWCL